MHHHFGIVPAGKCRIKSLEFRSAKFSVVRFIVAEDDLASFAVDFTAIQLLRLAHELHLVLLQIGEDFSGASLVAQLGELFGDFA